jgi:4-amino-4-deoxy-L-arabinose transferase-like glycosyltransferase
MTRSRQALLLLALCCALYLPGMASTQLYTRGEAREALAVREVVQTGHWLVPMRPDGQLTKKPPLFYWSGMATWRMVPTLPEAAVRLPSAIAGTLGVLAVAWLGHAALPLAAGTAALMLATSFEWMRSATSARVDMLLSAAMTLVMLGLAARLAGRARGWTSALVTVGTALAVLAKGPIGAGFPAAAVIATALARRDRGVLRLLIPLIAGGALAALWYLVAWLTHGQAFLDVVLAENLGRFVDTEKARTGHAHGAFFLVGVALVGLLPWTPLLPLVASRGSAPPAIRTLLLSWIVVITAIVTVSASKRSVYLLPIFPAVALLIADGLTAASTPRTSRMLRVTTAFYAPGVVLLAVLVLALVCGLDVTGIFHATLSPDDRTAIGAVQGAVHAARAPLAVVALALLGLAAWLARTRAAERWAALAPPVAAVMAIGVLTYQFAFRPAVEQSRGFAGFMPIVAGFVPADEPLYAYFPVDPSVRFYAPRAVVNWKMRPADRDVYLLAWEREVAVLPEAARPQLEQLAVSEARHGSRGSLVLVRVPRGALPPRRAAPPQNG